MEIMEGPSESEERFAKLKSKRKFIEKFYLNDSFFKMSFGSLIVSSFVTAILASVFFVPGMIAFFSLDAILLLLTGYSASDRCERKVIDKMIAIDKELNELKEKLGLVEEKSFNNELEKEENKSLIKEMIKSNQQENQNILSKTTKKQQEAVAYVADDGITSND